MGNLRADSRGFSAIEFIIAIAVLGAVFLMTLKGTVAISAFRAYVAVNQIQQYQARVQQYVAEYHYPPGDDPVAPQHWGHPLALMLTDGVAVSFAGDGVIQGYLSDPENVTGEQYMAWRDLRFAGIVEGDASLVGQSAQPENSFGGFYGFAEDNLGLQQVLCLTKVPAAKPG